MLHQFPLVLFSSLCYLITFPSVTSVVLLSRSSLSVLSGWTTPWRRSSSSWCLDSERVSDRSISPSLWFKVSFNYLTNMTNRFQPEHQHRCSEVKTDEPQTGKTGKASQHLTRTFLSEEKQKQTNQTYFLCSFLMFLHSESVSLLQ